MVIIGLKLVQYIQGQSLTTYDSIQRDWDTTDALCNGLLTICLTWTNECGLQCVASVLGH
jgi:hypothetical protein